ncbi:hypothetical protein TanjilG_08443 [Lupinus angustifolius]|uniref:MBD domain-containing protein n=1 Tax=Lupinus angustifolius TaxID=3871 RepID=A0A1J7H4L8_LUPAN|nr:hypothetical protein TanjilG_08443 [Lupinus angustifolius]
MDQGLTRGKGGSMLENDFVDPGFVQEPMTTSRVQPHLIYLEKNLIDRISETMEDLISEILEEIKAPAKPQTDEKQEDTVDLPSPSMVRAKDVGDSTIIKIYHHLLSGKIFRSKPEVVQFVLTEACPPKPGTSRKKPGKGRKRSNKSNKTPKTSRNKRTKVEEVKSQHVVEGVVSNQLNDAATINQDPILGSIASTINTNVSSNHEELKIHDLMSTEEMLNEYSIAYQRGEL